MATTIPPNLASSANAPNIDFTSSDISTYESESDSDYNSTEDEIGSDSEDSYKLTAQEQWDESLKQITLLLSLVIFPLIGKLLGRRMSKFIWRRFANWWWV
ncbi:hypothetical protein KGF54_003978 [Candida jiufengensis]|uniref:uncharacterized protein n=1 Tax=Candida jiufengensis TaxID=497108 RepID=UPI002224F549|nr:uncharacterized protein KGF54_003978 [Candida jiufengensis]KAI5950904.1 hypothetical protein KGF54_003978 [Candida jiufengensis]